MNFQLCKRYFVLYFGSKIDESNLKTTEKFQKLQLDSFKTAVNKKIKELQKRDYVEKSRRAAIDYVLLFIPNESISNFIQEKFPDIVDQALDNKVVLCSPTNLYAFLAIVRQANQTFQTQKATGEILGLLAGFNSEWKKYVAAVGDVRSNFDKLTESMDLVVKGARFNKLAVAVRRMEELRDQKGIEPVGIGISSDISDYEDNREQKNMYLCCGQNGL